MSLKSLNVDENPDMDLGFSATPFWPPLQTGGAVSVEKTCVTHSISEGEELCRFSSRFGEMRSRSSSLEDVLEAEPGRRMEARKKSAERRGRHREPLGDTGTVQRNHRNGTGSAGSPAKAGGREKGRDLSRDDLIFLLSLLEGELQVLEASGDPWWPERAPQPGSGSASSSSSSLQARDEVITVLKADKLDVALLEAKYGFVTPQNVLQALQRDAVQGRADAFQEDIYQKPMEEVAPAHRQPRGPSSADRCLTSTAGQTGGEAEGDAGADAAAAAASGASAPASAAAAGG